jgi:hypothetical protein
METMAVIMMVLILGLLWGGLALALRLAYKKEMAKKHNDWKSVISG